ncbi:MAG TPA: hypothetical protein PLW80_09440, partial [Spirochaetales bacterium]|nr:hypothetical protein [Spirochaetales bacterium]
MDFNRFSEGVRELVEKTQLFGSEPLEAVLLANPRAGGFSRPARAAALTRDLAQAVSDASALPARSASLSWRVAQTSGP